MLGLASCSLTTSLCPAALLHPRALLGLGLELEKGTSSPLPLLPCSNHIHVWIKHTCF